MLKLFIIAVMVPIIATSCVDQDSLLAVTGNSGTPGENLIPDDLTVVWRNECVTIAVKASTPLGRYLATAAGASYLERFGPDSYMRETEGPVYSVPGVGKAIKGVDRVMLNCLIVRDVAERFAAGNSGAYFCNWSTQDSQGRHFVEYLPNELLLPNPLHHNLEDSPVLCEDPGSGQVGFFAHPDVDCEHAYCICGADHECNIICMIIRTPAAIDSPERTRL